jgi:hypothetical protein
MGAYNAPAVCCQKNPIQRTAPIHRGVFGAAYSSAGFA